MINRSNNIAKKCRDIVPLHAFVGDRFFLDSHSENTICLVRMSTSVNVVFRFSVISQAGDEKN